MLKQFERHIEKTTRLPDYQTAYLLRPYPGDYDFMRLYIPPIPYGMILP
jgi:hypothetical protein